MAGETVLSTGQVPRVDTWTIVGAGMRWISQDWLSNTIMAALLGAGGSYGETLLSLLFGALVVLAFALLWRAVSVRKPGAGWLDVRRLDHAETVDERFDLMERDETINQLLEDLKARRSAGS